MHYCPGCRKSYHENCLIDHGWVDTATGTQRGEKPPKHSGRLSRDICFERSLEVESLKYAALPALKRFRNPSSAKLPLEITYSRLPLDLLKLARSPIVRGGYEHGVVGNVFPVMRARNYVHKALMEREPMPDNWREEVSANLSKVEAWVAEDDNFICPNCHGVI